MFGLFKKGKIEERLELLSTKEDIERVIAQVLSTQETIISEVGMIPDREKLIGLLAEHITSPLKEYVAQELSSNQAVKQPAANRLSSNQAVKQKKTLDQTINELKYNMDRLTQRHIKILNVLAQNRDVWMGYEEIGQFCSPQLTGSCIRGYIADLINVYSIPLEKKSFGRQNKVKIPQGVLKKIASIHKL